MRQMPTRPNETGRRAVPGGPAAFVGAPAGENASPMIAEGPERDDLRERLGEALDEALGLCDQLALGRIGCHVQMARDLLGEEAWQPAGAESSIRPWPECDDTGDEAAEIP
jgi:hypothetical protein